jgi:ABC-2 type transport system permease protein
MKKIFAICFRDIHSLLVVPTGAIVAALFVFSSGIVFVAKVLSPNTIASFQPMFEFGAWLLLLLCPAITMRLVAEERRVGTWELLLASPVSSFQLAKGKFLSALLFLAIVLATTFPLVVVLELYATVDYGAVASGYLGLFLLGSAVIGTGLVVSACTNSQTVAYLVTAFVWLTLSLSMKVLPAYVPTRFADFFFAVDPDLRTAPFSIGLIDSANIVYFLSIVIVSGWLAIAAINRTRGATSSITKIVFSIVLLLVSLVSINSISMNNNVRFRLDATGSRAYTLSEQTVNLLSGIENRWKIVVLLDDSTTPKSVVRQVDEVLRRYEQASSNVSVQRINPSDVSSLNEYEALLRELIALYGNELEVSERAINNGIDGFSSLMTFALSTSAWAESLSQLQSTREEQDTFRTLSDALSLVGSEGNLILDEVHKAMDVHDGQPLPRIELARDILVAASGRWSRELAEVAWWLSQERSDSVATICKNEVPSFESMSIRLAEVDDSLRRLGDIEIGRLASQLAIGEGALILSPDRATMIPASMLFPKNIGGSSTIAIDQRFRGEQIISSAMRSLQSDVMPTVVFVHAEKKSLLGQQQNNVDVRAVRGLLETSRFGVREWVPFDGPRPMLNDGPIVWVIVPPSNRAGLAPTAREQRLLDAVKGLLADDEPVLLNLQPSLLPRYGQKDPWSVIADSIGISADTEKVILERVAIGPNALGTQRGQMVSEMQGDHLIARAVSGRQLYLPLPLAVRGGESLISVSPTPDRWLDSTWEVEYAQLDAIVPFTDSVPIATAVVHHGGARAVVVGSGGWLLSWAADRAVSLGGDKVAMVNPGNSELLLASVEWLSGLDDWISPSPIGQQSSRVSGLSQREYLIWSGVLILGLPLALVGAAVIVSMRRNE